MVVTTSLKGFLSKVFSAFSRMMRPNVVWTPVLLGFFTLLACAYVSPSPAHAAAGINQQINFQGRLLNQQGATVPDGYYNIQFKIYQDGDGQSVGNTTGSPAGTLLWTESHLNNNSQGVVVKNGFLSVQLGSINAFGSQIDWNQDTLWLSMNIGNTNGTCTPFSSCSPDGEMVPMKRLTAVPYALNSRYLNGLASSNFVQLAQGVQTDNNTASSIFINKTNTGNLLQFQNAGNDIFTVSNAGDLTFGANANHTLSIATAAASTAGKTLTLAAGAGGSGAGSAGGDLVLAAGAAGGTDGNGGNITLNAGAKTGTGTDGTISIGTSNTSAITLGQNTTITTGKSLTVNGDSFTDLTGDGLTDASGALAVDAASSTGFYRNGGNSFSTGGVLGTNDNNSLAIRTNSINRLTLDTSGTLYVGDGTTSTGTGTFTIQGSTGAAANAGYNLSLLGGTGGSNSNGGDITLQGGAGAGTGVQGQVKLAAGGYTTTTISAYGSNSTISQSAVDNYSSVAISASTTGLTITVPAPTTKYDGRVLYIQLTGSNPITLSPSGGSSTSMSVNSVYALVWNTALNGWLAAGTDSNGFIQNQNSANQTANFRISGTGQANTGFVGPSLDTVAAAGTLTLGGTNATTINLGNSTAATAVTLQGGTSGTAIGIQSGAAGTISVGTANAANTIIIGSSTLSSGTQNITVGGANTAGGTQNVTVGSASGAAAGSTTIQSKDNTTIATNGTTRATFDTTGKLYLGDGITSTATGTFTIQGSTGAASNAGYGIKIQGGTAGSGAVNGGDVTLVGGTSAGGVQGQVKIASGGFTTATTQNFTANANVTQANVDNYSSIEITASGGGPWTATVPAPTTKYNGRLLYIQISTISGASTINIAPNGGTTITMSPSTGVTLIWNTTINAGAGGWLNAGADSGNNSYIQNQSSTDQAASFRINGQAIAPTFKSKDSSGGGNSDNLVLQSGDQVSGSGTSGTVTITSGNATSGNRSSGNVSIDVGTKSGTGTTGTLSMGTANAAAISIGYVGVTTTNYGNLTVGGSAGSGTTFTNNGATVNASLAVTDRTAGTSWLSGASSDATTTVDKYTSFTVNQSTTGVTVQIPSPTVTTAGRIIYLANIGSASFSLLNSTLNAGSTATLLWNGTAWTFAGADGTSINNQKTAGQNADFWIQSGGSSTGVGRADGGFQAPSLERATSGTLSIGTTSNTTTLNLGGSGATGGVTIQGGTTSTVAINTSGAGTVAVGGGNTANIDIGSVAASTTASTIRIGNSSGAAQTLTMGSTASTSTTTIQGGVNGTTPTVSVQAATNAYIAIGTANANTIQVGAVGSTANNSTVNIANSSAGAQTVNVGSSSSTSTTTILGGVNGTTPTVSIQGATNAYLAFGTTNANNISIGTLNSAGTTTVTLGANSGATAGTTTIQSKDETVFKTNGTTRATFASGSNTLYLGNASNSGTAASPNSFTIQATSNSGTGAGAGLTIQAGNSGSAANGADLTLNSGTGGNSVNGQVIISTPTFKAYTGSLQVCSGSTSSMTVSQPSVDNFGTVAVASTSSANCVISVPDPTIKVVGRVLYVTADSTSSSNFTLSINGGGAGNLVSMRANSSATLVWNGNKWAPAGASSSTTLQAAYDNTIQSSGGAELIVSKTGSTNGLTIRDSTGTNAVNGALLTVQSGSAANLMSVNSNVTEYASNAGAESYDSAVGTTTFPSNTWAKQGNASVAVTRNITTGNNTIATGQGSVSVVTTANADDGVKNQIVDPTQSTPTAFALTPNNHYNVSFSVRLPSGAANTFTDLKVDYSKDGTTTGLTNCTTGQSVAINIWTKINCSFTAPSSGITSSNVIMIRQAGGTARTFYIDNLSVTIAADYSLASDGNVDSALGTNWVAVGGVTSLTRDTTYGQNASSSVNVVSSTANTGVKNLLSINPNPSTLYRVTAYVAATATFSTFKIQYTYNNSTLTDCQDYKYTPATISTSPSTFTKVTCYINTPSNSVTSPYIYFTQTDSSAHTWYVDAFSMTLASATTPNVQVGSGTNGGPTTLFTLDRGASAPIAGDNESLLGSMYYDTTLGKLQCYEADGWGACGSSPDNIITISPEYTNAVMHGTGVGTMTSDLCSDFLDINDATHGTAICGSNENYNFYNWTSPQASSQTYSVYVTYQLPSTFKSFTSGSTSLQGRVSSTSNASVNYSIYKSTGSSMTQCGTTVSVANGAANAWETKVASGAADPSACGFAPGNSIVFKISLSANSNANAYIGNIGFTFSNN